MDTSLGWESNKLIVQRTSNPLIATLYIVRSGPIASEKEMGTSGCTGKCLHQFTFSYPWYIPWSATPLRFRMTKPHGKGLGRLYDKPMCVAMLILKLKSVGATLIIQKGL